MKDKIKKFLAQWDMYIKWRRGYSYITIITVLFSIFAIEYYIINFCFKFLRALFNFICRRKKKVDPNEEIKEKNVEEIKKVDDDKKEGGDKPKKD